MSGPDHFPCPISELGRHPVRPDAPAGDPVEEDDRFDELQEIVDSAGLKPWDRVIQDSGALMTEVGKDLRVMAFLSLGLFQRDGYAGLADAYQCWCDLLGPLWEDIYPRSPRRRLTAVRKLIVKTSQWAAAQRPDAADEAIEACARNGAAFELLLVERFAPEAPSNEEVQQFLDWAVRERLAAQAEERAEASAPEPQSAAEEAEEEAEATEEVAVEAAEEATPAPTQRSARPPTPRSTPARPKPAPAKAGERAAQKIAKSLERGGGHAALKAARGEVLKLVEAARVESPDRAFCYRLSRDWALSSLNTPPLEEGDTTRIPPPDSRVVNALAVKAREGDWEALITSAEKAWQSRLFWLDPHRHTAHALRKLGREGPRLAVERRVRELVERLPALKTLRFSDGQPLADKETLRWLTAAGSRGAATPPAAAAVAAADADDSDRSGARAALLTDCALLISEREPGRAAALIEAQLRALPDLRSRFQLKSRFAELLMDASYTSEALPLLRALDEEIEQYHLEKWEPALAAGVLRGLLASTRQIGDNSAVEALQFRLARVGFLSLLMVGQ